MGKPVARIAARAEARPRRPAPRGIARSRTPPAPLKTARSCRSLTLFKSWVSIAVLPSVSARLPTRAATRAGRRAASADRPSSASPRAPVESGCACARLHRRPAEIDAPSDPAPDTPPPLGTTRTAAAPPQGPPNDPTRIESAPPQVRGPPSNQAEGGPLPHRARPQGPCRPSKGVSGPSRLVSGLPAYRGERPPRSAGRPRAARQA